jgi:hypothetical protein
LASRQTDRPTDPATSARHYAIRFSIHLSLDNSSSGRGDRHRRGNGFGVLTLARYAAVDASIRSTPGLDRSPQTPHTVPNHPFDATLPQHRLVTLAERIANRSWITVVFGINVGYNFGPRCCELRLLEHRLEAVRRRLHERGVKRPGHRQR